MAFDVKRSDLHERVGEGGELTGLDKALIEMMTRNFSPEMMSDQLGGAVSPERCLARTKEILRSTNVWDVVEKQAALMYDFVEVKNILFDRVRSEGGIYETKNGMEFWTQGDPRWSANLIKVLKEFRSMIEATEAAVNKNAGTLRDGQRDLVFASIEKMFNHFLFDLEQYLGARVDKPKLLEMMERAIPVGFAMIEEKTISA
jgi:hypothetical protein